MASLRLHLVHEAKRLANDDGPATGDGYRVSSAAIRHLQRTAQLAEDPERALTWAWRSQRTRHDETGWHVDGLAAMYLLATLIDVQDVAVTSVFSRPLRRSGTDG